MPAKPAAPPRASIHTILAQFRADAANNRELGDRFEKLICRYLELDPLYQDRFSGVWLWNEWPAKGQVGDVGIDNAEGRQRVVIELYDKFFRTAFPKVAERLGIVYTPVEVVDFIIRSVDEVLQHEFQSCLADRDVHIIDPFTGTGTFIVRLLQSGLIPHRALLHKYQHELHANEIILLAYYIAAINIEETFHSLHRPATTYSDRKREPQVVAADYIPFEGIVLTDTFQLSETKGVMDETMFPENNRRVKRQKAAPIRVIIGNPPYSVGQGDANANNQNLKYPQLDDRIRATYAARSGAANKNSLYDSYIRALRWASDRISGKGVVGFVTNGYFLDGSATAGIRACLPKEFSTVYVFNLRGNQRTSGETSRMEGGKIFGSGSRAGIAISLFIKNPERKGDCQIHYHDIGDYLDREEKLGIIRNFQSINGLHRAKKWQQIQPNDSHDWINQRDPAFEKFIPLGDKKADDARVVFENYSRGLATSRDAWCYNFSRSQVASNMRRMIESYNGEVKRMARLTAGKSRLEAQKIVDKAVDTDPRKISWSDGLLADLVNGVAHSFDGDSLRFANYRPFCKQWAYFNRELNERVYQMPKIFPKADIENRSICMTGVGNRDDFSAIVCDILPDLHMADKNGASQCFPLFLYEIDADTEEEGGNEKSPKQFDLLSEERPGELVGGYRRRSAITDAIHTDFRKAYESNVSKGGKKVSKEDIFYYVYGILHSPEYHRRFASDLKKMLPRIPFTQETKDFWAFSTAGRELAHWHLNYETIEPYPLTEHRNELTVNPERDYLVQKMTFARRDKQVDKTTIIYNSHITLSGIPLDAYDYVVNGKPAIEWIMDRYQVTVDKDSGIRNDPSDWAKEHNEPRYILDLVKRIVRVSLETNRIVATLPPLNEINGGQ